MVAEGAEHASGTPLSAACIAAAGGDGDSSARKGAARTSTMVSVSDVTEDVTDVSNRKGVNTSNLGTRYCRHPYMRRVNIDPVAVPIRVNFLAVRG